jgi:hypothetical protein
LDAAPGGGELTMRAPKAAESAAIAREHLTRLLLEQMERTYGTEGQPGMTRMVTGLLRRLDDSALRDYAYSLGLTSELELEPEDPSLDRRSPEEPS